MSPLTAAHLGSADPPRFSDRRAFTPNDGSSSIVLHPADIRFDSGVTGQHRRGSTHRHHTQVHR